MTSTAQATPSSPDSAIAFRSLTKIYETESGSEVRALEEINFDIRRGEFFSIVGPSGCGKSTLLKMCAGLLTASRGAVEINGKTIREPSAETGVVFQAPTLLEWRTVLENAALIADVQNLPRAKIHARARELLDMVGLSDFVDKYPAELSGGMQQRVGITRALVHNPTILLMDEPFGALDALTRESMTLDLQRIWLQQGITVVFITHSISEAVLLSDRVAVMSARPGRVLDIIELDFPRPRDFRLLEDPEFAAAASRIRRLLDAEQLTD